MGDYTDYTKIFIRLGHDTLTNGSFTGAEGILIEKKVIDAYGEALRSKLVSLGWEVKMFRPVSGTYATRTEGLAAGIQAADDWGADVFISCHANASDSSSAKGTEVYYNNIGISSLFAEDICSTICSSLGTTSRGAKDGITAGYYEMKNTTVPAIIIEPFFITNQSDCNKYNAYTGSKLGKDIATTVDSCIWNYT